jgi:hypothetical protein
VTPARTSQRPTSEQAAPRPDLYLEPDSLHFHAERVKAAAEILDELQRGSLLSADAPSDLRQIVLRDGLIHVLLEDSRILEREARGAMKGKESATWTQAVLLRPLEGLSRSPADQAAR